MNITIIGTGNVAQVLGHLLKKAGHSIIEVVGRHRDKVEALAQSLGCTACVAGDELQPSLPADVIVIAISDAALMQLPVFSMGQHGLWVHTAGSVPMQVLEKKAKNVGVLYPLQSLRSEKKDYDNIPFLLTAKDKNDEAQLAELVNSMGYTSLPCTDRQRLIYHLAAVWANNFCNYMLVAAADICDREQLPFGVLHPLIMETAMRSATGHPENFMTGPAARGDGPTMEKHLTLLNGNNALAALYTSISAAIANDFGPKNFV